ncbi:MAG: hypothetical protein ACJ78Q_03300, partial [Chloroflexia bacterium]
MAATDVAKPRVARPRAKNEIGPIARRRIKWGYFFLMPWLIGFVFFQILPIVATVFLSFTNYNATKEFAIGNFNFVGLNNYGRLFSDPDLIRSLG